MGQTPVHPAALDIEQLSAECDMRRLRRSGPGGQRRNKVETAVVLLHRPTGVSAEASERRSQAENRSAALFRLRVNLAIQVRSIRGPQYTPSTLWRSRCTGSQISVSESHDDFPAVLAEALDVIASREADVKTAATTLGCTASQLVKLLKRQSRALALVNRWRSERDLHPLK